MSASQGASGEGFAFEVFYDGDCPLCMREMNLLMQKDREGRIRFTDIAAADFAPESIGIDRDALMKKIHGRMPSGEIVEGVEVFRQLYAAVGFGKLVQASRTPGISQLLDIGYTLFARNRLRLTGRCVDGQCEVPEKPRTAAAP